MNNQDIDNHELIERLLREIDKSRPDIINRNKYKANKRNSIEVKQK